MKIIKLSWWQHVCTFLGTFYNIIKYRGIKNANKATEREIEGLKKELKRKLRLLRWINK